MKQDNQSNDNLNSLIAQAKIYSKHMMEATGSVPPTLMALTPEGFMMFVPASVANENEKDQFANAGRLLAVGYNATAVAMILESWITFATRPGQPLDVTPPSQSPDRKEVIVIMGETRESCAQQFLFIQRNSSGKFTGFGTSLLPQFDDMQGRFAQMMPPKVPGENEVFMARSLLTAMGVKVTSAGFNPMWN